MFIWCLCWYDTEPSKTRIHIAKSYLCTTWLRACDVSNLWGIITTKISSVLIPSMVALIVYPGRYIPLKNCMDFPHSIVRFKNLELVEQVKGSFFFLTTTSTYIGHWLLQNMEMFVEASESSYWSMGADLPCLLRWSLPSLLPGLSMKSLACLNAAVLFRKYCGCHVAVSTYLESCFGGLLMSKRPFFANFTPSVLLRCLHIFKVNVSRAK